MNQIFIAFITGLTTGGISCLAVQGGLLATALTTQEQKLSKPLSKKTSVIAFVASKLLAYTILGFLLGLIGASLIITPSLQGWMQIFAGLFMLCSAANMLNLHPIFRYAALTPPKWVFRLIRKQIHSTSFITPIVLGTLTVLIPCGITQGMMVIAISSGSAISGAGIMFAFILGTSPVFILLGLAAGELLKKKSFVYIGSAMIAIMGILSINAGQALRGSPHTIQNYYKAFGSLFKNTNQTNTNLGLIQNGVQEAKITVSSFGYKSETTALKVGVPVKLTLITNNTSGCSRAFTIPTLGISKILPETGSVVIEFTPTKPGRLVYTCSMGMYSGEFNII